MDGAAALERSYDDLGARMGKVGPTELALPSPCEGWDVRAMLNHTLGAGWMFTLVNQGQSVGEDAGDVVGADPAAALAEVRKANLESWQGPGALEGERTYPFGTFPAEVALLINIGEIELHAWDLARATGQDETLDPDVVQMLWDFYAALPMDGYRAHGAFGPEVAVPESAPLQDRLLGYIGRTV
jgi:uncharacterized protein (TIGR03086 family)